MAFPLAQESWQAQVRRGWRSLPRCSIRGHWFWPLLTGRPDPPCTIQSDEKGLTFCWWN